MLLSLLRIRKRRSHRKIQQPTHKIKFLWELLLQAAANVDKLTLFLMCTQLTAISDLSTLIAKSQANSNCCQKLPSQICLVVSTEAHPLICFRGLTQHCSPMCHTTIWLSDFHQHNTWQRIHFYFCTGVWLRTSCSLGRCSTTWAKPPALFTLVILEIVSISAQAGLDDEPPIYASGSSWDDRCMPPYPALSVEMKSHKFFCLGWPWTVILLNSASCIAGMTGAHHCTQLLVEMGGRGILKIFLFRLALNHNPPNLYLPSS
jgi:hypothetical protein